MRSQEWELDEIIDLILDHVPDIRPCQVNKLWHNRVRQHTDYINLWGKKVVLDAMNIVKYGQPKMICLCEDTENMFINAGKRGRLDFIKRLENHAKITVACKRKTFVEACYNNQLTIVKHLHNYRNRAEIYLRCFSAGTNIMDDIALIEYLKKHSLLMNDVGYGVYSIVDRTINANNVDLFRQLYEKWPRDAFEYAMGTAIKNSNMDIIKYLIQQGAFDN